MPNITLIQSYADELTAIRRDFHAHPEIGFEEKRTSSIVAEKLAQWGIEVHRGLGVTGLVGVLRGRGGKGRPVGPRAHLDPPPQDEGTHLPLPSPIPKPFPHIRHYH